MSYEAMRTQFASSIMNLVETDTMKQILTALDVIADHYRIEKECTDIILSDGLPEVVEEYIASLAIAGRTKGTLNNYFWHIRDFFRNVRKSYNQVTSNDLRIYLFRYEQEHGIEKSTLDFIQRILKRFFTWLVDHDYLLKNPTKGMEAVKFQQSTRKALPPVALEYLRLGCKTLREKALVDFLSSTGCRISECAALTLDDINWNDRSVHILHGKGDKERITFFDAEAEVSLKKYLASRKGESNVLFCCSRAPYNQITPKSLQVEVAKIRSRAEGLPFKVTPHHLRHTFATNMVNHGMPIQDLQKLMGHSKLDTTMVYTHISNENIKNSYRKYSN